MAFTQDGISYIGTDGRDSLVLTTGVGSWEFPTGGPAFIEALGDDDQVTFNGNAQAVTLVAGDGNDLTKIFSPGGATGQLSASSLNGNYGDDVIEWFNITNTSMYGGQGSDSLRTLASGGGGVTNASEIQGNKGADEIILTGSLTFNTVYGGQDGDFIDIEAAGFSNSIQGNKGNDDIVVAFNGPGTRSNEVYGGQDDDCIDALDTDSSILLSGDKGDDVIRGGGYFGDGAQILDGGDGRDILIYEGNQNTTMIGGEGPDVFRFNMVSGGTIFDGAAPFVEDFDTVEDTIELNVNLLTTGGKPFVTGGTNTPALNGFFGPTTSCDFVGYGFPIFAATGQGDFNFFVGMSSADQLLTTTYKDATELALLSGHLSDRMLFKAGNLGQLIAQISRVATQNWGGVSTDSKFFALGFTQDSRKLYAFTGVDVVTVAYDGSANRITDVEYNLRTIAQFATNNVNGSDIYFV